MSDILAAVKLLDDKHLIVEREQFNAMRGALLLVQRGMESGKIRDQTILTGSKMQPLSKIIAKALKSS